jgi:hypothetical protein
MTTIDFTNSPRIELPFIDEIAAKQFSKKGWSLSSVYYFSEIRDVYLALRKRPLRGFDEFTAFCESLPLPFVKTPWNKRRLLEHVNALVNFSLVNSEYQVIRDVFTSSEIGAPLSASELHIFEEIYFTYFRFKEIFSWFVEPNPASRLELVQQLTRNDIKARAEPLFSFSEYGRFTDTWFRRLENNTPLYYLKHKFKNSGGKVVTGNEDLMRFWDCFVVWGVRLGLLEKFSLTDLGLKTVSGRDIACCYLIKRTTAKMNLLEYLDCQFRENHIYLPELVFRIATDFRLSVIETQRLIIEEYKSHKESLSFERTSEIFVKRADIRDTDKILFPRYRDSYVSHLVIRR